MAQTRPLKHLNHFVCVNLSKQRISLNSSAYWKQRVSRSWALSNLNYKYPPNIIFISAWPSCEPIQKIQDITNVSGRQPELQLLAHSIWVWEVWLECVHKFKNILTVVRSLIYILLMFYHWIIVRMFISHIFLFFRVLLWNIIHSLIFNSLTWLSRKPGVLFVIILFVFVIPWSQSLFFDLSEPTMTSKQKQILIISCIVAVTFLVSALVLCCLYKCYSRKKQVVSVWNWNHIC